MHKDESAQILTAQVLTDKNPRKTITAIDELAASIKERGVLNPILVRRRGDRYDLIGGARRLLACVQLGYDRIPARILDVSEEEADELRMIDNAQRVDVHPLEEADAYQALMRRPTAAKDPASWVAARVGKSRAHIVGRLALLELPEKGRVAFLAGKIGLEIAVLLARIGDPKLREKACAHALKPTELEFDNDGFGDRGIAGQITPAGLRDWIRGELMRDLSTAPFDRNDAKLVPAAGACGPCPKRTGNDLDLFGDLGSPDVCNDPICFRSKLDAAFAIRAAAAKAKGQQVLPAAASKKIFSKWDASRIDHGCGYEDPEADCYEASRKMSLRKYLGDKAPPLLLVQDGNGIPREVYETEAVRRAKDAKLKTPDGKQKRSPAETRLREKRLKEEKAARLRKQAMYVARDKLLEAFRSSVARERDLTLLILAALQAGNWGGYSDSGLAIGPTDDITAAFPKAPTKDKPFLEWVESLGLSDLRGVLFLNLTARIKTNWRSEQAVKAMAEYFGLDWKELEKEALTRAEAAKAEAKKKKAVRR